MNRHHAYPVREYDGLDLTPRERVKVLFGIIVGTFGIAVILFALSVVPS